MSRLKYQMSSILFCLLIFTGCGKDQGFAPGFSSSDPGVLTFQAGSSYDFGASVAGQIVEATLTVVHVGGPVSQISTVIASPFRYKGGSYPGVGGTCGSSISANCTLVVNFEPSTSGSFSQNMRLNYQSVGTSLYAEISLTGSATLPSPTHLSIAGSSSVLTGECVPYVINSIALPNISAPVSGNKTVNLAVNSGTGTYYSDISCSSSITSTVITSGQSASTIYFKSNTSNQTPTLVASSSGLSSATKVINITGVATQLSVLAPNQIQIGECRAITISRLDGSNVPVASLSSLLINLASTGSAAYYSDSNCGTAITSATIASGSSSVVVYVLNSVAQSFTLTITDPSTGLSASTANVSSVNSLQWWNASFSKRIQITVDNSDQSINVTNQAVLIKLNSSIVGYSNFNSDGSDLRFTADDHTTVLDHEIEKWNVNGDSFVWVRVPSLPASSSRTIFMYFGNSGAAASENASSLWSRYSSVWHLKESPSGAAPQFKDSAAAGKNGTATNSPTSVSGIIGDALGLSGNYDSIDVGSLNSTLGNTATLSFWILTQQTGNNTNYLAPGVTGIEVAGGTNDIFWGWLDASGFIGVTAGNGVGAKSNLAINDNVWRHITITRDVSTGAVKFYVNGVLNNSGTSGAGSISTTFSKFGVIPTSTGGAGTEFDGSLDEIRILNVVLSDAEVKADFKMQNNSHVSFGSLEIF